MSNDLAVDDFLEHHGIKGMRWGHRKQRKHSTNNRPNNQPKKKSHKKAVVLGSAAAVAAIGVGAFFVKKNMGKVGPTKVSRMSVDVLNQGMRKMYEEGQAKDGRWIMDNVGRGPGPKPDYWDEHKLGPWVINRIRRSADDLEGRPLTMEEVRRLKGRFQGH